MLLGSVLYKWVEGDGDGEGGSCIVRQALATEE